MPFEAYPLFSDHMAHCCLVDRAAAFLLFFLVNCAFTFSIVIWIGLMMGGAEVVRRGLSDVCGLSSSAVVVLDGGVVNVIGMCSDCSRTESPLLRVVGMAFCLDFLCRLIVGLCRFALTAGGAVVKSLHALWVGRLSVDRIARVLLPGAGVVGIGGKLSEMLW